MSLTQSEYLEVKEIRGKGRGVIARQEIPANTVIERAPVLVLKDDEADDSTLVDYVYHWGRGTVALVLGYGSLYNHSYSPNARYDDIGRRTKVFTSLRRIAKGEEITINYLGDPDAKDELHFAVRD